MKNDRGRIILIIAMTACFAALFMLFADQQTVTEMYVESHRENGTTVVEQREDGTIYIGGEGKIVVDDLEQLMKEKGLGYNDMVDVVIGDEVTELGYNLFNRCRFIRTLKVGKSVSVIHNGALFKCRSLRYIFLPKGLQQVSQSFLLDSSPCVLTDAAPGELIGVGNIPSNNVIYNVNSMDELSDVLSELQSSVNDRRISSDQLYTDDPNAGSNPIVLHPGYIQYGPYISLAPGTYTVSISGHNLDRLTPDNLDCFSYNQYGRLQDVVIGESCISYVVVFDFWAGGAEFRIRNEGEDSLQIDGLEISMATADLPPALENWWT